MDTLTFVLLGLALVFAVFLNVFFKPPFGKNVVKLRTEQREIALTFDDGPNPPYTDRLLDVLAKHDVKATFFMIGSRIEKHPETVQRVIAEGHQIGNHSYSHPLLGFLPPSTVQKEIEQTDALIQQFGVSEDIAFRSPFLARYFPIAWVLSKQKRPHISCNVWSWDWMTQNPDKITKTVLKKTLSDAGIGSIIVLHDGIAKNESADRSGTIEATDRIIERLKQQEYQFVIIYGEV